MKNEPSPLTKEALRRSTRAALRGISPEERAAWSLEIRRRFMVDDSWLPRHGGTVAMFGGMPSEPDLLPLLPWLAEKGIGAALFLITGDSMEARLVQRASDLRAGVLGVLEPDPTVCELIPTERLETVLLPGLAFSRTDGARLGRGKGYYDRALATLPEASQRIGVCFHLQVHDHVPTDPHDRPVQSIVTEREWARIDVEAD